MAQQRADIRAQCGRKGVEEVQHDLDNGTYFNNEKEAGWAREWLEEKLREHHKDAREGRAEVRANIALIVSILGVIIALIALFNGSS